MPLLMREDPPLPIRHNRRVGIGPSWDVSRWLYLEHGNHQVDALSSLIVFSLFKTNLNGTFGAATIATAIVVVMDQTLPTIVRLSIAIIIITTTTRLEFTLLGHGRVHKDKSCIQTFPCPSPPPPTMVQPYSKWNHVGRHG